MSCPTCYRADCICPVPPRPRNRAERRAKSRPSAWWRRMREQGIDPYAMPVTLPVTP